MKISKKYIDLFANVLADAKQCNLADARVRDAVIKQLIELSKDFGEAKKKIIETFCIKDEEGNPLIEDNKYSFKTEILDELNKELDILAKEEVEVNSNNPEKVKEILENTNYNPKFGEVEQIDEIISLIK